MWVNKILNTLNTEIFISAAGLLLLGFIFGRLLNLFKLPRVTGYIIAGILFGPSFFKIFNENSLAQLDFIPRLALGIIALIIGAGLSLLISNSSGYFEFRSTIINITLMAVAFNEIFGPACARYALVKAKEAAIAQ